MPTRRSRSPRRSSPGRHHHYQNRHRNSPPKRKHSSPRRCVERYDSVARQTDEKNQAFHSLLKDNMQLKEQLHAFKQDLVATKGTHASELKSLNEKHARTAQELSQWQYKVAERDGRIEYLQYEWNKAVESIDERKKDNRALAVHLVTNHNEAVARQFGITDPKGLLLSVLAELGGPCDATAHDAAGLPSSQESARDASPSRGKSPPYDDASQQAAAMQQAPGGQPAGAALGPPVLAPEPTTAAAPMPAAPAGEAPAVVAPGPGEAAPDHPMEDDP